MQILLTIYFFFSFLFSFLLNIEIETNYHFTYMHPNTKIEITKFTNIQEKIKIDKKIVILIFHSRIPNTQVKRKAIHYLPSSWRP